MLRADVIAYDSVGTGAGQNLSNYSLGLDFEVNSPIIVSALGAYDGGPTAPDISGADRTNGIAVGIFNLSTEAQVGPTAKFSSTNPGTQIDSDAFLPVLISLPVGEYTVATYDDPNNNTGGSPNSDTTENSGAGAISFIDTGRYFQGAGLVFPATADNQEGTVSDPYDAGTFQFEPTPEPASVGLLAAGAIGLLTRRHRASN